MMGREVLTPAQWACISGLGCEAMGNNCDAIESITVKHRGAFQTDFTAKCRKIRLLSKIGRILPLPFSPNSSQ